MGEWQLIDSAPKDGSLILTARKLSSGWTYDIAWWTKYGWDDGEPVGGPFEPTHWKPLTPPTAS